MTQVMLARHSTKPRNRQIAVLELQLDQKIRPSIK